MLCCAYSLSHVQIFVTFWTTVACQAPLSLAFFRQQYLRGLLFPPPGDFPIPGIEPASTVSPALQADSLPTEKLRKPHYTDGEGNGNPLQYSCLENPKDGRAWEAAVHGIAKNRTWLSDFTFIFHFQALEKQMATPSSVLAWYMHILVYLHMLYMCTDYYRTFLGHRTWVSLIFLSKDKLFPRCVT